MSYLSMASSMMKNKNKNIIPNYNNDNIYSLKKKKLMNISVELNHTATS